MSVTRKVSCYRPEEDSELSTPSPTLDDPDMLLMMENNQAGALSNEISAPYEVPKFPIEQLESKLKDMKKTSVCPSGTNQVGDEDDFVFYVNHCLFTIPAIFPSSLHAAVILKYGLEPLP